MLFALPMSWALLSFVTVGPAPGQPSAASPVALAGVAEPIEEGPRVTLSLEPAATTGQTEPDVPIALPAGYLLPHDGSEESAHAGH
ncbi:MAG: hypothetical protein JWN86_3820 [Planctomycetota bacterium]|nr:hypothetical protein [Planctomycetota bacterium]